MTARLRCGVFVDIDYSVDRRGPSADIAFARLLAALGDHVDLTVFGRRHPGDSTARVRLHPATRFVELPWYPSLTAVRPFMSAIHSARRRIRSVEDTDVTWMFGPHPLADIVVRDLLRARRPVALGVRQHFPEYLESRVPRPFAPAARATGWAFERSFRSLAARCPTAVVGPALAAGYARSSCLRVVPISLVEPADLLAAPPDRARTGRIKVLSVGRLDPEKNPLLLLDVAERLHRHHPGRWALDVVGDGLLADALARGIRKLADPALVRMRGAIPLDDLPTWYRRADMFLHVSWTEGLPQVLFEASAAALPIVATDVGSVRAVFGGSSLIVPPGDAAAAANALMLLEGDRDRCAELRWSALRLAEQHTLETTVSSVVGFLEEAAGGS